MVSVFSPPLNGNQVSEPLQHLTNIHIISIKHTMFSSFMKMLLYIILLYSSVVLAFTNQQQYWMRTRIQSRYQTSLMSLTKLADEQQSWILIVEDESSLRNAIGKYLAEEGYYVTGVSDAQSALLICKGMVPPSRRLPDFITQHTNSTLPDCIVLDIQLNGEIDGIDLLKNVRSDSQLESIPVVLLTAKGRVDDRIAGYNAGADAYLPKPFDAEELLVIINGLKRKNNRDSIEGSDNTIINDIKRELREIKALLNEDASTQQPSNLSADSIYKEVVKIKEDIKAGNAVSNDDLTQSSTNTIPSQYNTLSILTPEETTIINYVCQGLSNKEIARYMGCSISKIEKSLSSMFKKVDVINRGDLAHWWKDYSTTLGDENASKVYKTKLEEVNNDTSKPKQETSSSLLTEEEEQVMNLLAKGYTTDEIESASKSTKKNITKLLNSLIKKAGVVNRTELVQWWKENGIND